MGILKKVSSVRLILTNCGIAVHRARDEKRQQKVDRTEVGQSRRAKTKEETREPKKRKEKCVKMTAPRLRLHYR